MVVTSVLLLTLKIRSPDSRSRPLKPSGKAWNFGIFKRSEGREVSYGSFDITLTSCLRFVKCDLVFYSKSKILCWLDWRRDIQLLLSLLMIQIHLLSSGAT